MESEEGTLSIMGGRGASSGMSAKGKPYGTEYHTVLTAGRVKFIKQNDEAASNKTPMETMTRARVYVLIGKNDAPKAVTYYDNANKRYKQIDIEGRPHKIDGKYVLPHAHYGYWHDEVGGSKNLTAKEKRSVDRIVSYWYHHMKGKE